MIKCRPAQLKWANKVGRAAWVLCWHLFYRTSPVFLHGWRRLLLRTFGATIADDVHPYPTARIWAPWNLTMEEGSCLADGVDCYCVDRVFVGKKATVSQYSFLCTASHDYSCPSMPLVTAPIRIEAHAWITSDVFVGPGVTIGEGAVVGARATVMRDVGPWMVAVGNPAREIKSRARIIGWTS